VLVVLFRDQFLGFKLIRGRGEVNGGGLWSGLGAVTRSFNDDVSPFSWFELQSIEGLNDLNQGGQE
jgi:hypothetical protein